MKNKICMLVILLMSVYQAQAASGGSWLQYAGAKTHDAAAKTGEYLAGWASWLIGHDAAFRKQKEDEFRSYHPWYEIKERFMSSTQNLDLQHAWTDWQSGTDVSKFYKFTDLLFQEYAIFFYHTKLIKIIKDRNLKNQIELHPYILKTPEFL